MLGKLVDFLINISAKSMQFNVLFFQEIINYLRTLKTIYFGHITEFNNKKSILIIILDKILNISIKKCRYLLYM